ncbi:MAG: LuxR C-terminal-related transcriptional regulator [Runella sp.]
MLTLKHPPNGIFIAKDDLLLCQTLKESLESRNLFVNGYTTEGSKVFSLIKNIQPDIVILGGEIQGVYGVDIVKCINQDYPLIKCIIYDRSKKKEHLLNALTINIQGYVFINSGFAELFYCIHEVIDNRQYLSPICNQILGDKNQVMTQKVNYDDLKLLTNREVEILKFISQCYTTAQIADHICRSIATVNNHRSNIMRKLKLKGVNQLLPYAIAVQNYLKDFSE